MGVSRREVLGLLAGRLLGQDPVTLQSPETATTFRSEARFIAVDVQVLSKGQPVRGLTKDDFIVWDNEASQPITNFGADDQLLDVLLSLDVSGSTGPLQEDIREAAAAAMTCLLPHDRMGIVIFNTRARLVAEPTENRAKVDAALRSVPMGGGGTELNRTAMVTARYLKRIARPEARRALVILTDNDGDRYVTDADTKNALWEADVVLNLLLFPLHGHSRPNSGDLRRFVAATGGESVKMKGRHIPMDELFRRMRQRYSLVYRAPYARAGEIRRIKVELRPQAKSRLKDLTIRSRSGYQV
jgi:VWFA-related protein